MKSGKEISLVSNNNNFKILTGAVQNYKAPVSIYLNITTWLVTVEKVKSLDLLIKEYNFYIKQYLKTSPHVIENFQLNNIVDIDISPTGIKGTKPTFFALEINLYQKNINPLPLVKPKHSKIPELKPILQKIANDIINLPIFVNSNNFEFRLTKKIK